MPVLPSSNSVFTWLVRWFVYPLSPHDDLLEGEVIHHLCFAPPWCTPHLLRFFLLFSSLDVLGGRTAFIVTTPFGLWSDVSTLGFRSWKTTSVPKRWFLWKSSWFWRFSALLLAWILSPFPIVLSIRKRVPLGLSAPSPSLHSPRGRFCWLPHIWITCVGAWWVRTPVQTLLASPPLGTGRLVLPPWQYSF